MDINETHIILMLVRNFCAMSRATFLEDLFKFQFSFMQSKGHIGPVDQN
jgi:hypothetical protein